MEIKEIGTRSRLFPEPNKTATENSHKSDTFNDLMNCLEKQVKEKIDRDLTNDETDNINMTDKKWHNLMSEIDNALYAFRESLKVRELNKSSSHNAPNHSAT